MKVILVATMLSLSLAACGERREELAQKQEEELSSVGIEEPTVAEIKQDAKDSAADAPILSIDPTPMTPEIPDRPKREPSLEAPASRVEQGPEVHPRSTN